MEKNIVTPENENKSFEELLDEFILENSSCGTSADFVNESDAEVIQPLVQMTKYNYDGCDYIIPAATECHYAVDDIKIRINGQSITLKSDFFKVYIDNGKLLLLSLLFDDIYSINELDNNAFSVYLYQLNNPVALAHFIKSGLSDSVMINVSDTIDNLSVGQYYILLNNINVEHERNDILDWGMNCVIPFKILPSGDMLNHPKIKRIKIIDSNKSYNSDNINFKISFDKPLDVLNDLTLHCYNSNLRLMGSCMYDYTVSSLSKKRDVSISLPSDLIWLPDHYTIIIQHNGEPFCKLEFSIIDHIVQNFNVIDLTTESLEYILMKYVEGKSLAWQSYSNMMNVCVERTKIVEHYNRVIINRMRDEYSLAPLMFNSNYVFITQGHHNESSIRRFSGLLNVEYSFQYIDCSKLFEPKNSVDPYEEATSLFDDCKENSICLYNLNGLISASIGKTFIQRMESKLSSVKKWSLILVGTDSEIKQLFEANPILSHHFENDNYIHVGDANVNELIHYFQLQLRKLNFIISHDIEEYITNAFIKSSDRGGINHWNETNIDDFISKAIFPNYQKRMIASHSVSSAELSQLSALDIDINYLDSNESAFDESIKCLNEMVGLNNIKNSLTTTFNRTKFNLLRKSKGFKSHSNTPHHMIFTGNPGTGKTTVAKMIGRIYHSMGLLSKGDVIVTERSQIVGRYIGETEKNMQAIISQARGNVLFIDEAYTLCDTTDDRKDFGYRAIECLLTILAQNNSDILIIMAGYQEDMNKMLDGNLGLKGRFPFNFHFDDYTTDELMKIGQIIITNQDYILANNAYKHMREIIELVVATKNGSFSNARWIEQFINNGVLPSMADRVCNNEDAIDEVSLFQTIIDEDIESAYQKMKLFDKQLFNTRRPIGFMVS